MQKRDFLSILLLMLLFIVFTAPGSVEFTPNADNTHSAGQEPTDYVQSDGFWDNAFPEMAGMAVTLTATKTDALFTDNNSNSEFDAGDVISYTVVIQNSGDMAENVFFDDTIDPNTTLVSGSLSITPIARNDSYVATGNISISVPDGAGDALGNDSDPDGGTLTVTAVQGSTANVGSATVTTATGLNSVKGSVTMQANGSFSYEPPPGFAGTDTFTYQVTDDEGDTDTATVSIVISDMVWFVDNSSGGSNLGTFSDPFTSTTSFNSAQGASAPNATDGDIIFVYKGSGAYTDGINLRNSQVLLGQGIDLLTELSNQGITQSSFSDLSSSPTSGAGNRPLLTDGSGNGIALLSGNTVKGLNVGNTSGVGITGSSVGNLTINNVGITGSGKAFDVNGGGTLSIDLDEVTVTSSASGGFSLQNTSGTTTLSNVTITTTSGTGLLASSAGTFTVTGSGNQIDATSGPAVNITNTTIGSSGVTFESVSANGGTNGIVLINTSSSAGLTVTGTGSAGSGGSITNKSGSDGGVAGNGIYLSGVTNVSLNWMNLSDHQNSGLYGTGVRGLTLNQMLFTGTNGDNNLLDESAVFLENLGGRVVMTNSTFNGGAQNGVRIENRSGTAPALTLIADGNTISDMQGSLTDVRGTAFLVEAMDGTADIDIRNNTFTYWWGNAVHVLIQGTASGTSRITGNTAHQTSGALAGSGGIWVAGGQHTYRIAGNSVRYTDGSAISADRVSAGSHMQGTIENNTVGLSGASNSGSTSGNGIFASHHGPGTTTHRVANNTLRQVSGQTSGFIRFIVGDAAGFGGSGTINATVTGNDIQETGGGAAINAHMGIMFTHGVQSGPPADADVGCYEVSSNTISNTVSQTDRIRMNQRFQGVARWPGYTGANNDNTAMIAFILGKNPAVANALVSNNVSAGGGGHTNTIPAGSACTLPDPLESLTTVEISNNEVYQYASPYGILLNTMEDSSNLNATVMGNTVANPGSLGVTADMMQVAGTTHIDEASARLEQTSFGEAETVKQSTRHARQPASSAAKFAGIWPSSYAAQEEVVLLASASNDPAELASLGVFPARTRIYALVPANVSTFSRLPQMETTIMDSPLRTHEIMMPAVTMFSGENVNVSLGNLDPGQEVTIEFRATIDDPLPSGVDRVQNQSTISGSNFSNVLTADPSPNSGYPPVNGETITPVNVELGLTLTVAEGWRMLSSPIDGLTYETMLGDLWTQGSGTTGTDYDGGTANVYTWPNDATGTWTSLNNLSQVIPAGAGLLIFVYADDVYDQDPAGVFPKTLTLSGSTHTGDIAAPMNTETDGFTLVGNPYIAPIDFDLLTSSGLTGVAYVYDSNLTGVSDPGPTDGNTGGWRTTDGNFGDLTGGIIAPGQGFLVQNAGAAGSLTFTEASKTTGGQFYGKQKELSNFVRLDVRGESGYNTVWIRFSGEGSVEPMYGDALELQPLSDQYTLLGARKADGTLLDIAQFPLPDEQLEIPLAVETTQGGSYTITATRMDLPAGTVLYLHDLETGKTTAIDPSLEYNFTLRDPQKTASKEVSTVAGGPAKATISGADRFVITTSPVKPARELPEQVALGQNYPNPFNPTTVISYQLPVNSEVRLEVYDMLGRRVATLVDGQIAAGTHQVSFDASGLSSGIYLYRLQVGGAILTKKLTVLK